MRSISHVRRRAATSIEYALILILIAAIIIGSVSLVGVNLNNVFQLFQSVFSSQSLIGGPWFSEGTANGGFTSNSTTDGLSYWLCAKTGWKTNPTVNHSIHIPNTFHDESRNPTILKILNRVTGQ